MCQRRKSSGVTDISMSHFLGPGVSEGPFRTQPSLMLCFKPAFSTLKMYNLSPVAKEAGPPPPKL